MALGKRRHRQIQFGAVYHINPPQCRLVHATRPFVLINTVRSPRHKRLLLMLFLEHLHCRARQAAIYTRYGNTKALFRQELLKLAHFSKVIPSSEL